MSDIYQSVYNKYKGSPSAVMLFVGAFIMFVIGINHFVEDTNSSKLGLESLERAYNLNVQIFEWSYWTMSIAPQIASIVFAYMWLSDTSKKGYGFLALGFQAMDFFADSWYRSNGNLFEDRGVTIISGILTFVYFSIGSEFFMTVGGGLLLKLSAPALATWKQTWSALKSANKGQYSEIKQEKQESHKHHHPQGKQGHNERIAELQKMYHGADRRNGSQMQKQGQGVGDKNHQNTQPRDEE
jgi:hypothetical protein